MIDEFPVNIYKSQAVTTPKTDNLFKVDVINPLNNNKAKFFIQLCLDFFCYAKDQDQTVIPILRFYALELNIPIKDIVTND